jgi:hypothetical protein
MTSLKAIVKDRRLELDAPADWPDGTEVEIHALKNGASAEAIPVDRETWLKFIEKTAGSITDPTFMRHPQGEVEEREPLS